MNKYQTIIDEAARLAEEGHRGQFRKNGEPYFNHCKRVRDNAVNYLNDAHRLDLEDWVCAGVEITALNHDLLEDNAEFFNVKFLPWIRLWKTSDPLEYNLLNLSVSAITAISKKEKGLEEYIDYCLRVKNHNWARIVKLADLQDNMSDLAPGNLRDKYSLTKYFLEN